MAVETQYGERVALVMAGTAGLGLGGARELARAGFSVVVCGRDQHRLDAAVSELALTGARVTGVVADVSDPEQLVALHDEVASVHGRLDVLVTNSGGPRKGSFDALDDAAWFEGIDLVLLSVVRSIRLALPQLRRSPSGRIIVIGSSSVRRPIPDLTLSNVLRPALAGLVKSLVGELGDAGVTINLIAPGRIDTDRVRAMDSWNAERRGVDSRDVRAASQGSIPMGRYGQPEEFGAMVAYVASVEARYLTGQTILVDGGHAPTLP